MALSITQGVSTSDQNLINALTKLQKPLSRQVLNSGGLAIKTAGSALAKTASTINVLFDGTLVSKAASDMTALSGTVTNVKFNVFVFTIDSAGTLRTRMGTEGASLATLAFPAIPDT